MQLLLPECILSYPSLGKPQKNNFDETQSPRFKMVGIFPIGTDMSPLEKAIGGIIDTEFKGKTPKNLPVKKCDTQIDKVTGLVQPLHQKGEFYITPWASEDHPPILVDPQGKPGYPVQNYKGGNTVQVLVNIWSSQSFGGTIGLSILAVQWRGQGEQITQSANLNLFNAVAPTDMGTEDNAGGFKFQ